MADDQILLDDEGMREFIRKGYVTFEAEMPAGFHETVFKRTEETMELSDNPGNNVIAVIPELQEVLDHPRVAGTLSSILGDNYELNAHRYCHRRDPGAERGYHLHQDGNSRHHHRTRSCMAFYYPQDTNLELGPTSVVPGSHYYSHEPDAEVGDEMPVCGAGGTVTIVHYDLWHRRTEKPGSGQRFMYKFLFDRMGEPTSPTWDCDDISWPDAEDRRNPMWRAMWTWSTGGNGNGSNGTGDADIGELMGRLEDANETTCFQAAYALAATGEPAVPELIARLSHDGEDVRRNAGYSLATMGQAAVPALLEAAGTELAEARAAAVDALSNMGLAAAPAVDTLGAALGDEEGAVRTAAAYGLGNVGDAATAAIPSLIDALADSEDWVVRNSLLTMAKLGPQAAEVVPSLAPCLRHENRYVRGKAELVLRRVGTPEATDALIEYLTTARWCPITTRDTPY